MNESGGRRHRHDRRSHEDGDLPQASTKNTLSGCDSRLSTVSTASTSSSSGLHNFFKALFRKGEKSGRKENPSKLRTLSEPKPLAGKDKQRVRLSPDSSSPSPPLSDRVANSVGQQVPDLAAASATALNGNSLSNLTVLSDSSTSCDSVFSTATTGFAFISPTSYQPHGLRGDYAAIETIPEPATDTYRNRLHEQRSFHSRDNVGQSECRSSLTNGALSLKKKYGLYGTTETLKSEHASQVQPTVPPKEVTLSLSGLLPPPVSSNYSDRSLPLNGRNQCDLVQNCAAYRRTWSECSIKKKTVVHVRGKRRAPTPPPRFISQDNIASHSRRSQSATYSSIARSTLKKRRAPLPPTDKPSHDGHAATVDDQSSASEMDRIRFFCSDPKRSPVSLGQREEVTESVESSQDGLQQNSLNLRINLNGSPVEQVTTPQSSPKLTQPLSPRPWYKRPLNGNNREPSSIPFRREVILRTVDKRRRKQDARDENKLPELGFMRQSKFSLFGSSKTSTAGSEKDNGAVKRRSGIGIPNISELDREAQEICGANRNVFEEVVLRQRTGPPPISDSEDEDVRRKSAKELISKFEASGPHRKTVPLEVLRKDLAIAKIDNPPDVLNNEATIAPSLLWTCPYCTLQNPNWRILCEACGKMKSALNATTTIEPVKVNKDQSLAEKEQKMIKYFFPKLSKSVSDSSIASSNLMTSAQFNKSSRGSPKLGDIDGFVDRLSPDRGAASSAVIVSTVTVIQDSCPESKKQNKSGTPDLEEVRHARLNHFRHHSPVRITDKDSLDRERQRLKNKIRAMNSKAFSEKYPVLQKTSSLDDNEPSYDRVYDHQRVVELLPPKSAIKSTGAIKKLPKKPEPTEENRNLSAFTTVLTPNQSTTQVIQTLEQEPSVPVYDKLDPKTRNQLDKVKFSRGEQIEVNELAEQLRSLEGRQDFKATLKYSEKTGTFVINKLLRSLESAILDGEHEVAASLAKDLAKMKVSLSVTRQNGARSVPESSDLKSIVIDLYVADKSSPLPLTVPWGLTILELKQRILSEFKHSISAQQISCHRTATPLDDDTKALSDYNIGGGDNKYALRLRLRESVEKTSAAKVDDSADVADESDDENNVQDGAMALMPESPYGTIRQPSWTCPLCTLINEWNKDACSACSKTKPVPVPEHDKSSKNNLNRKSVGAKVDKYPVNILCRDQTDTAQKKRQETTMFIEKLLGNPNITRTKYRGVDNFHPRNFVSVAAAATSLSQKEQEVKVTTILHEELMKLHEDKRDAVETVTPFECPICFTECEPGNGIVLRDCLHTFCRECLSKTVEFSTDAVIKCPFMDTVYSCESVLQEREIRAVVTEAVYERHLTTSIREAENRTENAFHCKTPNCRGWCIYEDQANEFRCPICRATNCLTCQVVHGGLNCRQYQDRMRSDCDTNADARQTKDMLDRMVADGEAMQCPTCQVILMKKWGCDWLKCSMCKTEVCWVTRGPRWGPAGKGDTSAGCLCGVFGQKCHPKCTYCH